jgi:serine protease inhibitor
MPSSPGPTVTVNQPFIFLIQDDAAGALLFVGRVTDPPG